MRTFSQHSLETWYKLAKTLNHLIFEEQEDMKWATQTNTMKCLIYRFICQAFLNLIVPAKDIYPVQLIIRASKSPALMPKVYVGSFRGYAMCLNSETRYSVIGVATRSATV